MIFHSGLTHQITTGGFIGIDIWYAPGKKRKTDYHGECNEVSNMRNELKLMENVQFRFKMKYFCDICFDSECLVQPDLH